MAGSIDYINTTIQDIKQVDIPVVSDIRGNLAVIEKDIVTFKIERVYYLFDVPSSSYRGGHAHKELLQLIVPLSGSFDVHVKDGKQERTITMNKPNKGLLVVPGIWREIDNFSSGAVCLVLASEVFEEADYIRDFETFKQSKNNK